MEWMAIAVLIWLASPTAQPPTIQVAIESEALCKEAVKALARDLGKVAAMKADLPPGFVLEPASRQVIPQPSLVLTTCVRIAN